MPNVFAVVCEADADFRTASELAERELCAAADWLEDYLKDCPLWFEFPGGRRYLLWTDVSKVAAANGVRPHPQGHFGDEPAQPDAHAARRALLLLKRLVPELQGVLLIRDDDRQPARRLGLEQARAHAAAELPVAVGLAHCNRECWVLAGFDPQDDAEQARLAELRGELGFDPRHRAHELSARKVEDKRNAKRVLAALTRGEPEREERCRSEMPLDVLRSRGAHSGLTEFLDEIRDLLAPVVVGKR